MKLALYARVSTGSDEQEQALEQQLDRLRTAAAGHEAVEYIDVMSGTRDDRPQLTRLLQACKRGEVDEVLCTRLDRMSRSMAHGAQLLTYFSAPDTPSLKALDDSLDLGTIGGRLVARMLINLGQAESERISERVSHGRAYQRRRQIPLGPKAPFGYRFNADRTNYELDPDNAPRARAVVERFLEIRELRGLLREIQEWPDCPWGSAMGLRSWLLNPTLAGYRVYGHDETYRDADGKLRKRRRKPGDYAEIHPNAHPPLITQMQHAQLNAVFAEQRNRQRCGLVKNYVRELTGLVICGHCNRTMSYQHHQRLGPIYLRCTRFDCENKHHNRIHVKTVKDRLWSELKGRQSELLQLAMGAQVLNSGGAEQEQKLAAEIKELERRGDPDLAEAIRRKKDRLAALMNQKLNTTDLEMQPEQIMRALSSEGFWQMAQEDEAMTRRMFTDYVERVVVTAKAISSVQLRIGEAASP